MNDILQNIKTEWSVNPRLKVMVLGVVAILMIYTLFWLDDIRQGLNNEVEAKQRALTKIERVKNELVWYDREKEAQSQVVLFENKLWQASSRGLAQAEIQALLRSLIDRHKLTNGRITLESVALAENEQSAKPIWRVSAQVRATFRGEQLQKVLWDIANSQKLLTVRSLNFSLNTNKNSFSNVTLLVDAWFELPEGERE